MIPKTRTYLRSHVQAVSVWYEVTPDAPFTVEDLIRDGFLPEEHRVDLWGGEIRIEIAENAWVEARSAGPDRRFGSDDDEVVREIDWALNDLDRAMREVRKATTGTLASGIVEGLHTWTGPRRTELRVRAHPDGSLFGTAAGPDRLIGTSDDLTVHEVDLQREAMNLAIGAMRRDHGDDPDPSRLPVYERLDRWGLRTSIWIEVDRSLELTSAGPDRVLATADDIVVREGRR